ncbi:hypothetical protein MUY35_01260 [Aliiroseovarius sp. S1339]|uniref:hypothetical protein n=1 Tax=Aliiroseovarius sp. S1339 TaxID=2936990 RepID=UPI0020BF1D7A|nr:hypothetical protein [Aliiroseovarius sp. S1339]MCK8462475.1 hypothetical protein [Aliiroseovarius sp. S1339]
MTRRPNLSGSIGRRPSVGTRIDDLDRLDDLSPSDRERLDRVIDEVGRIDAIDVRDVLVVTEPRPKVETSKLTPQSVAEALKKATAAERPTSDARLHNVTGLVVEFLREKDPEAFPKTTIDIGKNGPSIPLASKSLEQLLQYAARDRAKGEASVIWDDGINQLVVHLGRIKSTVTSGRVRVDIPVEADGLRDTMSVPIAVGSKTTVAGTVMATVDRPAGNALVARVWGDALIALAHSSIVAATASVAGAVGVDAKNQRLIAGALTATRGRLTIDSIAARGQIERARR